MTQPPIIHKVIRDIATAKIEILATMHFAEEQQNPLPLAYFYFLKLKMDQGIKIKRLVFGQITLPTAHKNHQEKICKTYRRMILIDRKILFYKKNGNFYSSKDPQLIKKYLTYFQKEWGT